VPLVGETWADRPVERALILWVFPLVGMLFFGGVAGVLVHQAREERQVGYVVSAPVNCRLGLADRPGGSARLTVEQDHPVRNTVCEPPARGTRVFYDPHTRREIGNPDDDRTGALVFGGLALISLSGGVVARLLLARHRRRIQPNPTHVAL
jgi:hypothetical protein